MARGPAPSCHQDGSLPYSQAPAVSVRLLSFRYYEAATTAHIFSRRPSVLGLDGVPSGLPQGQCRLSQVPREPQRAFALLSDSGRASVPSLHDTSVLPPHKLTRRASATMLLSELYHTASALTVYASCRHY